MAVIQNDPAESLPILGYFNVLAWIAKKFTRADYSPFSEAGIRELLDSIAASEHVRALNDISERFASAAELELDPVVCHRILNRLDQAAQAVLHQVYNGIFGDSVGDSISDANWHAIIKY